MELGDDLDFTRTGHIEKIHKLYVNLLLHWVWGDRRHGRKLIVSLSLFSQLSNGDYIFGVWYFCYICTYKMHKIVYRTKRIYFYESFQHVINNLPTDESYNRRWIALLQLFHSWKGKKYYGASPMAQFRIYFTNSYMHEPFFFFLMILNII